MNFSTLLLPLIIILFAVPLFMGTRKQRRAQQQQQDMQSSLRYGDRVMTTSGLYGTVVATSDNSIDIEIADGVVTSWLRAAVREKVADSVVEHEPEPVVDEADDEAAAAPVEDAVPQTEAEVAAPLEQSSKKAR